jgi:hypothetical protein
MYPVASSSSSSPMNHTIPTESSSNNHPILPNMVDRQTYIRDLMTRMKLGQLNRNEKDGFYYSALHSGSSIDTRQPVIMSDTNQPMRTKKEPSLSKSYNVVVVPNNDKTGPVKVSSSTKPSSTTSISTLKDINVLNNNTHALFLINRIKSQGNVKNLVKTHRISVAEPSLVNEVAKGSSRIQETNGVHPVTKVLDVQRPTLATTESVEDKTKLFSFVQHKLQKTEKDTEQLVHRVTRIASSSNEKQTQPIPRGSIVNGTNLMKTQQLLEPATVKVDKLVIPQLDQNSSTEQSKVDSRDAQYKNITHVSHQLQSKINDDWMQKGTALKSGLQKNVPRKEENGSQLERKNSSDLHIQRGRIVNASSLKTGRLERPITTTGQELASQFDQNSTGQTRVAIIHIKNVTQPSYQLQSKAGAFAQRDTESKSGLEQVVEQKNVSNIDFHTETIARVPIVTNRTQRIQAVQPDEESKGKSEQTISRKGEKGSRLEQKNVSIIDFQTETATQLPIIASGTQRIQVVKREEEHDEVTRSSQRVNGHSVDSQPTLEVEPLRVTDQTNSTSMVNASQSKRDIVGKRDMKLAKRLEYAAFIEQKTKSQIEARRKEEEEINNLIRNSVSMDKILESYFQEIPTQGLATKNTNLYDNTTESVMSKSSANYPDTHDLNMIQWIEDQERYWEGKLKSSPSMDTDIHVQTRTSLDKLP